MSITFKCCNEKCRGSFTVPSKFAGKTAKCKLCETKNTVPVQVAESGILLELAGVGSTATANSDGNYEFKGAELPETTQTSPIKTYSEGYKKLHEQKIQEGKNDEPRESDTPEKTDEEVSKDARGAFGAIFMVIGFILLLMAYWAVFSMPHRLILGSQKGWDVWAIDAFWTANYFFSGWFFLLFGRLTQLGGKAF